jgi:hypothetical protein
VASSGSFKSFVLTEDGSRSRAFILAAS